MGAENENNENQPVRSLERTIDIVPEILSNPEFANEVKRHHGWPEELTQEQTAILFLVGRFQWAISVFNLRTETLRRETEGLVTRIAVLEDLVQHLRENSRG